MSITDPFIHHILNDQEGSIREDIIREGIMDGTIFQDGDMIYKQDGNWKLALPQIDMEEFVQIKREVDIEGLL